MATSLFPFGDIERDLRIAQWDLAYSWGDPDGQYSLLGHTHYEYSLVTHTHTGVNSIVTHLHDGLYSPLYHTHSGVYVEVGDIDPFDTSSIDINMLWGMLGAIQFSQLSLDLQSTISYNSTGLVDAKKALEDAILLFNAGMLDMDAYASSIELTDEQILLMASRLNIAEGSIDTSRISVEAALIRLEAAEGFINSQEVRLVTQMDITSNSWTVKTQDNGDGSSYVAGVGLMVYPDWVPGIVQVPGEFVWYNGEAYNPKISHTSSIANAPPNTTYWEHKPYGSKSAFGVLADSFFVQSASGSKSIPFVIKDGVVYINGTLLVGGAGATPAVTLDTLVNNAAHAIASVEAMEADSVFSVAEKVTWRVQWQAMDGEYNTLRANAASLGVSVALLDSARNSVYNFLNITHGIFNTPLMETSLSPGDLKSKVETFYKTISSVTNNITQARADIAQAAATAFAAAQVAAESTRADAYADNIVTAVEAAAIAAANAYAYSKYVESLAYADGVATAAETDAINAAKTYADAQKSLAVITAAAYADGIVDTEEARAIADATAKANAAKAAANAYTEGWADYGADKTQTELDNGASIYYATVNGTTLISGGYIRTSLLQTGSILIDKLGAMTGRLHFTDAGEISFYNSSQYIYGNSSGITVLAGVSQQLGVWTNRIYMSSKASSSATIDLVANGSATIGSLLSSTYVGAIQNVVLDSGTSTYGTYIKRNGTTAFVFGSAGLYPYSTSYNLGGTSNNWGSVYADKFYDSGVQLLDTYDDLALLAEFKPRTKKVKDSKGAESLAIITGGKSNAQYLDLHSLPDWMINKDAVRVKLKADSGELLTDADIEEYLLDYDEAGWMLSRDVSAFNDLTNGAVRQLDIEMKELVELMAARITHLENKVKILTQGKEI